MTQPIGAPLELPCGAVLPNRLCKAAMTEGLADPRNRAGPEHACLYRLWSEGGAGLLLSGNIQVDRRHLERPGNVALDNNGGERELAAMATAGRAAGNHFWAQISHSGRQTPSNVNAEPLAPSAVPLDMPDLPGFSTAVPRAMTEAEIEDVVERFGAAAAAVREAGFTGVQIHAAHGYLLSQFLNPLANRRTDRWGGSLENRARLLLAVVDRVRAAVGADFPVGLKLNSSDFQKGGMTNAESSDIVSWLGERGIDLLEISGGSWEQPSLLGVSVQADQGVDAPRESTRQREAYFLEYASHMRARAPMPIMVTGGFRSSRAMSAALDAGDLDIVGLARPLIVEPDLAGRLLRGETAGADPSLVPADPINAMSWYYMQLRSLGAGRGIDRHLSGAVAAQRHAVLEDEAATALDRR